MLENVSWLKTPIVEYPPNHWKIFTGKNSKKMVVSGFQIFPTKPSH
jgi:hypothetical protein